MQQGHLLVLTLFLPRLKRSLCWQWVLRRLGCGWDSICFYECELQLVGLWLGLARSSSHQTCLIIICGLLFSRLTIFNSDLNLRVEHALLFGSDILFRSLSRRDLELLFLFLGCVIISAAIVTIVWKYLLLDNIFSNDPQASAGRACLLIIVESEVVIVASVEIVFEIVIIVFIFFKFLRVLLKYANQLIFLGNPWRLDYGSLRVCACKVVIAM